MNAYEKVYTYHTSCEAVVSDDEHTALRITTDVMVHVIALAHARGYL